MPTRPTKGDHGTADAGSRGRGGQKATYGSAVSDDVAKGRREAGLDDDTDGAAGIDGTGGNAGTDDQQGERSGERARGGDA